MKTRIQAAVVFYGWIVLGTVCLPERTAFGASADGSLAASAPSGGRSGSGPSAHRPRGAASAGSGYGANLSGSRPTYGYYGYFHEHSAGGSHSPSRRGGAGGSDSGGHYYGHPYYRYYLYPDYYYYYYYPTYPSVPPSYSHHRYLIPSGSYTVADVQEKLNRLGYYYGRIDGVLGAGTRAAIRAYQRDRLMPVTGRVDIPLLWDLGL